MKNKWFLIFGIFVIVLIILAAFAMPLIHNTMAGQALGLGYGNNPGFQRPMMNGDFGHRGMMPFGNGRVGMGNYLPLGFGFMFFMFFFRLIPWAIIGLILWGVYQLGKKAGIKSTLTAAPVVAAAAPVVTPEETK